jgi:hypothetical protein
MRKQVGIGNVIQGKRWEGGIILKYICMNMESDNGRKSYYIVNLNKLELHTIQIHIYIYIYVCVCVCVWERERDDCVI